jgi:hypothetical protein
MDCGYEGTGRPAIAPGAGSIKRRIRFGLGAEIPLSE